MHTRKRNPQLHRKGKILLLLPWIVLPFITLAFWGMGGGSGPDGPDRPTAGLNARLPEAQIPVQSKDKLDIYRRARMDSIRRSNLAETRSTVFPGFNRLPAAADSNALQHAPVVSEHLASSQAGIRRQLKALDNLLSAPANAGNAAVPTLEEPAELTYPSSALDLPGFRAMENSLQQAFSPSPPDPEMQQIQKILETILAIQHPRRLGLDSGQMAGHTRSEQPLQVQARQKAVPLETWFQGDSILDMYVTDYPDTTSVNAFYSLSKSAADHRSGLAAIRAEIQGDQPVKSGGKVKLRLLESMMIQGHPIPAGSPVYAQASLQGQRLRLSITHIRKGPVIFPVQLTAFDLDGMPGIYIPDLPGKQLSQQGSQQLLQGLSLGSLSPSFGQQAATAGLQLGTRLLGKRTRTVRVHLNSGYQLLLKDESFNMKTKE